MNEVRFRLSISREEFLLYYQGKLGNIQVKTLSGRVVQFPVSLMVKYVEHSGVNGYFRIIYNNNNKLVSLEKISN